MMMMMVSSSTRTVQVVLSCLLLLIFSFSSNDNNGVVVKANNQIPPVVSDDNDIDDNDDDDSSPPLSSPPLKNNTNHHCDLYMAESSIPNAGLGVYAGKDFKLGETIGNPTIGIPLIDMEFNRTNPDELLKKFGSLPEFLWETQNIGGYGEAVHVDLFIPGIGSLINHHSALDNVIASGLNLDRNLLREKNPMAGSFTSYHKFTLIAKRNIQIGEELFVDKTSPNDQYIIHNLLSPLMKGSTSLMFSTKEKEVETTTSVINPTANDYIEADDIVTSLLNSNLHNQLTESQYIDLLYRLKNEILSSFESTGTSYHRHDYNIKNVAHILPSSLEELQLLGTFKNNGVSSNDNGDGGGDDDGNNSSPMTAKLRLKVRTIEWIQNNGQCMDGITEGTSTIKDAGRGAFATKPFVKGSTVSITPLIQIPDKSVLDINTIGDDNDDDDDNTNNNPNNNSTKQLLYNYCFGHRKSTLLLCPTTHAALINHGSGNGNSDSDDGKKEANVAIRWVRRSNNLFNGNHHEDLTVGPLDGLDVNTTDLGSYNTRLFFEYIALKDIERGDELILDYGTEYENALSNHLEHGTSSSSSSMNGNNQYISASTLMKFNSNNKLPIHLVDDEDEDDIVNRSHMFECEIYPNQKIMPNPEWEDLASNRNVDKQNWPEEFVAWYKNNEFASWYPCMVVESDTSTDMHDIELFVKPITTTTKVVGRLFRHVPGHRIRIVDGYYQSDQHLPWAFRQYIPIDDSIFPLRWRDDYQTASSLNLGSKSALAGNAELQKDYETSLRQVKCGLYLAKSNIPNAGFGIYTAVDIPASDIGIGTSLTMIPVVSLDRRLLGKSVMDYVWSAKSFGTGSDLGMPNTSFLGGMIGAMANAHAGITNIKMGGKSGTQHYVLDRSTDPGAGAFSPYSELMFDSVYPINAGEELFVSYGENWFKTRAKFQDVPMKQNFMEADSILAAIWAMASLEEAQIQPDAVRGLLRIISEQIVNADHRRTRTALGAVQTLDDLSHVVGRNGTAPATVEAKSAEWLDENGFCLDHMYVKRSTIHQAGFGAFSRRALKKGTVISSAPAITHSRDDMLLNNITELPADKVKDINEKQLMMNYHFGHKNSSLLFFPLTQALDINHNSKRKISGQEPNARVEFSTKNPRSRYIIGRTLDDVKKEKYSAVVLDFIATRDIEPDEEIFIDYGKEWEDAWDKHVGEWSSPCSSNFWGGGTCTKSSRVISSMGADKFNKAYHGWSDDHFAVCNIDTSALDDKDYIILVESAPMDFFESMKTRESYEGIGYNHEGFTLVPLMAQSFPQTYRPCMIMSSSKSSDEFNVVAFTQAQGKRILIKVEKQQSKDLHFIMKRFKSDLFVSGTFRHEIMIPDESFPSLWKDLE